MNLYEKMKSGIYVIAEMLYLRTGDLYHIIVSIIKTLPGATIVKSKQNKLKMKYLISWKRKKNNGDKMCYEK